ncbi:MAG TPA: hypothetical protein VN281_22910, partial [Verrucomicrobiae bacterium]|nr:hypothetical protein [Verrucomicrobiae bacterium]
MYGGRTGVVGIEYVRFGFMGTGGATAVDAGLGMATDGIPAPVIERGSLRPPTFLEGTSGTG